MLPDAVEFSSRKAVKASYALYGCTAQLYVGIVLRHATSTCNKDNNRHAVRTTTQNLRTATDEIVRNDQPAACWRQVRCMSWTERKYQTGISSPRLARHSVVDSTPSWASSSSDSQMKKNGISSILGLGTFLALTPHHGGFSAELFQGAVQFVFQSQVALGDYDRNISAENAGSKPKKNAVVFGPVINLQPTFVLMKASEQSALYKLFR